jgi:predicted nucleic acid-binding protein
MNILADTNVWCDYFRQGDPALSQLIEFGFLSIHSLVIGELAVGNLPARRQTLEDLRAFPEIRPATFDETHVLLEDRALFGKGLHWNDLLILASVVTSPGTLLWTRDQRLARAAAGLSVSWDPA